MKYNKENIACLIKKIGSVGLLLLFSLSLPYYACGQNNSCSQALLLNDSTKVSGTIGLAPLTQFNCDIYNHYSNHWYKYVGDDNLVKINLASNANMSITILEGTCSSYECLPSADEVVFQKGKEYFIVINKAYETLTPTSYTLTLLKSPYVLYDFCDSAFSVEYDKFFQLDFDKLTESREESTNDYSLEKLGWIKFIGDGKFNTLKFLDSPTAFLGIHATNNDCSDIKFYNRISSTESFSFISELGKEYYFALEDLVPHDLFEKKVKLILNSMNGNTSRLHCGEAIDVACGSSIAIAFDAALPITEVNTSCHQNSTVEKAIWLKIPENSGTQEITFIGNTAYFSLSALLIESKSDMESCDNLECIGSFQIHSIENKVVIESHPNKPLFLKLYTEDIGKIDTINVKCIEAAPSNTCYENAAIPQCGDTINIGLYPIVSSIKCNASDRSIWYKLQGENVLHQFEYLKEHFESSIYLYEVDENNNSPALINPINSLGSLGHKFNILTESNKTYYLEIKSIKDKNQLLYTCSANTNKFCGLSKEIFCGSHVDLQSMPINYAGPDPNGKIVPFAYFFKYFAKDTAATISASNFIGNVNIFTSSCDTIKTLASIANYSSDPISSRDFKFKSGETYYIQVEIYDASSPQPAIDIICNPQIPENNIATAPLLQCGVNGTSIYDFPLSNTLLDLSLDIETYNQLLWYKLIGNGNLIKLTALNENAKANFSIYKAQNNMPSENIENFYGSLTFQTEVDHPYFIGVSRHIWYSSFPIASHQFSCIDTVVSGTCNLATPIECGSTVNASISFTQGDDNSSYAWFTIQGEGKFYEFDHIYGRNLNFAFYKYNCELSSSTFDFTLALQNNQKSNKFFLKKGITYFLKIETSYEDYSFSLDCIDKASTSGIENAIEISCNDPVVFNASKGVLNPIYLEGKFSFTLENSQWYSFVADGSQLKIVPENGFNSNIEHQFFKAINDSVYTAVDLYSEYINNNLLTTKDTKYYLLVYSSVSTTKDEVFMLKCSNNKNETCNEAQEIQCGSDFDFNNIFSNKTSFFNLSKEEKGNWYRIAGTGQQMLISSNYEYLADARFKVYLAFGKCDSVHSAQGFNFENNAKEFLFNTIKDEDIYLFISTPTPSEVKFSLTCQDSLYNSTCSKAKPISCGETILDNSFFSQSENPNSCLNVKPGLYYTIKGNGGVIEIKSENNLSQYQEVNVVKGNCINGPCIKNDYINKFYNKSIYFQTEKDSIYFLKIVSNELNAIAFKIECHENRNNLNCDNSITISCDTTIYAEILPLSNIPNNLCRQGYNPLWYKLPINGQAYRLKVKNLQNSNGLQFSHQIEVGDCISIDCMVFADFESGGYFNTLHFISNSATANHLVFYMPEPSFNQSFEFEFSCFEPATNDFCGYATKVNCGDTMIGNLKNATLSLPNNQCLVNAKAVDLWYKLQGNGNTITIAEAGNNKFVGYINVFESNTNCQDKICIGSCYTKINPSSFTFSTRVGYDYYFAVGGLDYDNDFKIQLTCAEPSPHDNCKDAYEMSNTTEDVTLNFNGLTDDRLPCNIKPIKAGLWLRKAGNDSTFVLNLKNSAAADLEVTLMSGNCDTLKCIFQNVRLKANKLNYFLEKGTDYYFYIVSFGEDPIMHYETIDGIFNNTCIGASQFQCNDTIYFNAVDYMIDYSSKYCNSGIQSVAWYEYTGDGNLLIIDKVDFATSPYFNLYEACDTTCLYTPYSFDIINYPEFAYLTELGKKYLIKVTIPFPKFEAKLNFRCSLPYDNIKKENAQKLECKAYLLDQTRIGDDFKHNNQFNSLWYKFIGNGKNIKITAPSDHALNLYDGANIVYNFYGTNDSFLTIQGELYYIQVPKINKAIYFEVNYDCIDNVKDELSLASQLSISPNPFTHYTNVNFYANSGGNADVEIVNTMGQVIYRNSILVKSGENHFKLHKSDLYNAGIYICKLKFEGKTMCGKLLFLE